MTATRTDFATLELVRFLLARIDDEEQALRKLVRRTHLAGDSDHDESFDRARSDLIAKRQTLGHVQLLLVLRDLPSERTVRDAATHILQSMAGPYSSHVQYREVWHAAQR